MAHSCSSSSCNEWRKRNPNVFCGSGGGSTNVGVSLFCLCGEKCVLRTARTAKNKGKQFWGCPKYKNGSEDGGCNYFRWSTDDGIVERDKSVKFEGKTESFAKREEMEGGWKIISDLGKSMKRLEKRIKVLIGMVSVVCLMNIIIVTIWMNNP